MQNNEDTFRESIPEIKAKNRYTKNVGWGSFMKLHAI